jgi:hypothetical protein
VNHEFVAAPARLNCGSQSPRAEYPAGRSSSRSVRRVGHRQ